MCWTIITARREKGLVRKRERKLWQSNSLNGWIRNKSQVVSFFFFFFPSFLEGGMNLDHCSLSPSPHPRLSQSRMGTEKEWGEESKCTKILKREPSVGVFDQRGINRRSHYSECLLECLKITTSILLKTVDLPSKFYRTVKRHMHEPSNERHSTNGVNYYIYLHEYFIAKWELH